LIAHRALSSRAAWPTYFAVVLLRHRGLPRLRQAHARLDLGAGEVDARIEPHADRRARAISRCDSSQPNHVMQWGLAVGQRLRAGTSRCSAMSMRATSARRQPRSALRAASIIPPCHEERDRPVEGRHRRCRWPGVWMHASFLNVGDTRSPKSLGNFTPAHRSRSRGVSPLSLFRWMCFTAKLPPARLHRRRHQGGAASAPAASATSSLRAGGERSPRRTLGRPLRGASRRSRVWHDLNLPQAIAWCRARAQANRTEAAARGSAPSSISTACSACGWPKCAVRSICRPTSARAHRATRSRPQKQKDWARADLLRGRSAGAALVEDTSEGVRVKVKTPLQGGA
jgi:cysteinyl-tRNA synthetase